MFASEDEDDEDMRTVRSPHRNGTNPFSPHSVLTMQTTCASPPPPPPLKSKAGRATASVPIHLRLVNPVILRIAGPQPLTFCCMCDCVTGISACLELALQMSQSLCCTCLAIHENIIMKMPLGKNMPADAWLPLSKCRQLHCNQSMYGGRPAPYGVPYRR
jgi:hypothetical protein